jgi:hypothetical protein
MEQAQIVLDLFLPADQYTSKAMHPTVRALDYPTPSLVADLTFESLRLFISGPNMQGRAKFFPQFPDFVIVVAFIEA